MDSRGAVAILILSMKYENFLKFWSTVLIIKEGPGKYSPGGKILRAQYPTQNPTPQTDPNQLELEQYEDDWLRIKQ